MMLHVPCDHSIYRIASRPRYLPKWSCANTWLELLPRWRTRMLLLASLLCVARPPQVAGDVLEPGAFVPLAFIGRETNSNDVPSHVLTMSDGSIIVAGTSSPQQRMDESDLGIPLVAGLRQEDFFIAKLNGNQSFFEWVYRGGTSKEDRIHAMLMSKSRDEAYIAGRTYGQFSRTVRKGQSDIFIVKYDVSGAKPTELWPVPLILGTTASDAVTALAIDPKDENVIYACGFTNGSLFPGRGENATGLSDAILFSFHAANGSVIHMRQFGTEFADHATAIVLPDKEDGPLFVSVTTERQIGQYAFGNFHMYKFRKSLSPLGDLLLQTYSREQVVSFQEHPILPNTLFGSGSSWLTTRNGYDVFVKRVIQTFDNSEIGSQAVDIDEVGTDEYTKRIQSEDGSHDYASGMIIDPETGRLIICGYTAGIFAPAAAKRGILAPFLAVVDPIDASLTDAKQMLLRTENSWAEIASVTMDAGNSGVYYVAKESNETTNQFYISLGYFKFPALWKTSVSLAASQKATPSPVADTAKSNTTPEAKFPFTIIIACVCGGLLLVLAVIGLVLGINMKKIHRKQLVYDPQKSQLPESTKTRKPQPRMEGPRVQGKNASGLV